MGRWAQSRKRGGVAPGLTVPAPVGPLPLLMDYHFHDFGGGDFHFILTSLGQPIPAGATTFYYQFGLGVPEADGDGVNGLPVIPGADLFNVPSGTEVFMRCNWRDASGNDMNPLAEWFDVGNAS
jgi:hypothetical protein